MFLLSDVRNRVVNSEHESLSDSTCKQLPPCLYTYLKRGHATWTAVCMLESRLSTTSKQSQPFKQTQSWSHWKKCLTQGETVAQPWILCFQLHKNEYSSSYMYLQFTPGCCSTTPVYCCLLSCSNRTVGVFKQSVAKKYYNVRLSTVTNFYLKCNGNSLVVQFCLVKLNCPELHLCDCNVLQFLILFYKYSNVKLQ